MPVRFVDVDSSVCNGFIADVARALDSTDVHIDPPPSDAGACSADQLIDGCPRREFVDNYYTVTRTLTALATQADAGMMCVEELRARCGASFQTCEAELRDRVEQLISSP